jgi:Uma2 family endonuclease
MSALPHNHSLSEDEYLDWLRNSDIRYEYVDGQLLAMVGASADHVQISDNVYYTLRTRLRGTPCHPYHADMQVLAGSHHFYPDVTVVCGERQLVEDESLAMLLNPALIVEVLSPTTEAFDRGRKFQLYRTITSLQDYVLVTQNTAHVECFSRAADDSWVLRQATGLRETIHLPSLDVRLPLAEIYERVTFESE